MEKMFLFAGVFAVLTAMIIAQVKAFPSHHPKTDLIIDLLNLLGAQR